MPPTLRRDLGAREAIEAANVRRHCRLPCGPDSHPIENAFALVDYDVWRSEVNRAQECEAVASK